MLVKRHGGVVKQIDPRGGVPHTLLVFGIGGNGMHGGGPWTMLQLDGFAQDGLASWVVGVAAPIQIPGLPIVFHCLGNHWVNVWEGVLVHQFEYGVSPGVQLDGGGE